MFAGKRRLPAAGWADQDDERQFRDGNGHLRFLLCVFAPLRETFFNFFQIPPSEWAHRPPHLPFQRQRSAPRTRNAHQSSAAIARTARASTRTDDPCDETSPPANSQTAGCTQHSASSTPPHSASQTQQAHVRTPPAAADPGAPSPRPPPPHQTPPTADRDTSTTLAST